MYGHWRWPSRVGASDFFVLRATLAKPSCQPRGSMVPEPLAPRAERACAGPARSPIPPAGRDLRSTLLPRLRQRKRKPPLTIRTQMFRRVLRSPLVLAVWIPPRRRALQGPRRREARRNAQSRKELPNDRPARKLTMFIHDPRGAGFRPCPSKGARIARSASSWEPRVRARSAGEPTIASDHLCSSRAIQTVSNARRCVRHRGVGEERGEMRPPRRSTGYRSRILKINCERRSS